MNTFVRLYCLDRDCCSLIHCTLISISRVWKIIDDMSTSCKSVTAQSTPSLLLLLTSVQYQSLNSNAAETFCLVSDGHRFSLADLLTAASCPSAWRIWHRHIWAPSLWRFCPQIVYLAIQMSHCLCSLFIKTENVTIICKEACLLGADWLLSMSQTRCWS